MSLLFYLRRALQLPPHETARRAWNLLSGEVRARWRRWQDRRTATYTDAIPSTLTLQRYFGPLPLDLLRPHRERIIQLAALALAHRFDLLGSGWVEVRHGMTCAGIEGHRYPSGPTVQADPEGQWLRGRINASNLSRSVGIWRLVSPGYKPIDWSLDFITGHRWAETTSAHDVKDSVRPGVDIKVPWELARMQHLPALAWAHALAVAGEPGLLSGTVYRNEFQDQVLDFLATNPPRYGVNWKCTMDVAIRAAGWLLTHDLFRAHGADFDPDFESAFRRGIYEHGRHVVEHLEWHPTIRANHYLSNLAGLTFIAGYLCGSEEVDRWLAFALAELVEEVALQFWPDGSNFEASTSYHRLSAEMVVYATALGLAVPESRLRTLATLGPSDFRPGTPARLRLVQRTGTVPLPFPPEHFRRLAGMAEFTRAISRPDGRAPLIGDNDNGRFLKVWPALVPSHEQPREDLGDHRHLLAALNAFLQRSDLARAAGEAVIETEVVRRLAGPDRLAALGTLPHGDADQDQMIGVRAFRDFGLFVFGTAEFTVIVRCGPVGQNGNGGHAHNDQLSLELLLGGRPVVVDPGTYVYTSLWQERNRFRSTAAHNTLVIDRREQNDWVEGRLGLFSLDDRSRAHVLELGPGLFSGEHTGYGVPHRRRLVGGERVEGEDYCPLPGDKRVLFHLAPDVKVQEVAAERAVVVDVDGTLLSFSAEGGRWSVVPAWYAPSYGVRLPAHCCELRFTGDSIRWCISVAGRATRSTNSVRP
jgi:hypothetical protein